MGGKRDMSTLPEDIVGSWSFQLSSFRLLDIAGPLLVSDGTSRFQPASFTGVTQPIAAAARTPMLTGMRLSNKCHRRACVLSWSSPTA